MNACIISIGNELLIGEVVNTNAAFIAEKLNGIGIAVNRIVTIADDESDIARTLEQSFPVFDVVIVTGGLGPTHDDVTKKALCRYFAADLVSSTEARSHIERILNEHGMPWSASAEEQALILHGAIVIPNPNGTAPGQLIERGETRVVLLPGVPYEMERMMIESIVPLLSAKSGRSVILHRTLRTASIPESILAAKIGDVVKILRGEGALAFLPSPSGVRMRISVTDSDADRAAEKIRRIETEIRERVEKYIYGVDGEELEAVVGELLLERNLSIAIAESCTGGMIANAITNVPGSSRYIELAIVAYSNDSKVQLLAVDPAIIRRYGAVSREAAEAMARGIRKAANSDVGLSTTGIAGPTGGTAEKPVGLVWIGYSDARNTFAMKFMFGNHRLRTKLRATYAGLELVRRTILNIE